MKVITARFKSNCSETAQPIKKGDRMLYDYNRKKCYCDTSSKYIDHIECINTANHIDNHENAYFDQFCQNNNI